MFVYVFFCNHLGGRVCLVATKILCNWLAWSRLRQKSDHFLPDEADFFDRSSATVKKICEVGRKMGLFGPDSVPPNQLLFYTCCALNGLKPPKGV
jgi:hypothetical protein